MKRFLTYKTVYFIGIGGIGMSALARYFNHAGCVVSGYDKVETPLTKKMTSEGVTIRYEEDAGEILSGCNPENTLVVYTPAISEDNNILRFARSHPYKVVKRAEALGILSQEGICLAVAGTHGKTTTSCLLAHIMQASNCKPTAFLGGISNNYNSNLLLGSGDHVVVEADEYDRSFMSLSPNTTILTSMDADHLDIYGNAEALIDTFQAFVDLLPIDGHLILKYGLPVKSNAMVQTYGFDQNADLSAQNIRIENGFFVFDLCGVVERKGVIMGMPGKHNIENALGATLAALYNGVDVDLIIKALQTFSGVKRRFEHRVRKANLVYIDDYAHHPTEIEACVNSVRILYPDKKITGVFQPHLFSRTRDFVQEFAASLSLLDKLVMLDIYPAREEPLPGVTSQWLLDKVSLDDKRLCNKDEVIAYVLEEEPEVLITLGAGDIGQLVEPLTEVLS